MVSQSWLEQKGESQLLPTLPISALWDLTLVAWCRPHREYWNPRKKQTLHSQGLAYLRASCQTLSRTLPIGHLQVSKLFNPVILYLETLPSQEIIQGKWGDGRNLMHKETPNKEDVWENYKSKMSCYLSIRKDVDTDCDSIMLKSTIKENIV